METPGDFATNRFTERGFWTRHANRTAINFELVWGFSMGLWAETRKPEILSERLQLHRCEVSCVRIFRIAQAQLEDLRVGTHDETFARHKLGVLWTWRVLGIPGSTFHGSRNPQIKGQA